MYHMLNPSVAQKVGINAALVAQVIYDELFDDAYWAKCKVIGDTTWIRGSYPELATVLGCMSVDMVASAVHKLLKEHVIKRAKLSDDRFDHSGWYAFTHTGKKVMSSKFSNGYE